MMREYNRKSFKDDLTRFPKLIHIPRSVVIIVSVRKEYLIQGLTDTAPAIQSWDGRSRNILRLFTCHRLPHRIYNENY